MKADSGQAEGAQRRAADDRDFLRQQIEVAQLSERLARVTDAVRRRNEAEAVLESSRVDDALVARIEAAGIEVAKAEAAAATGAATITVRSHRRRRRGDRRSGRCAPRRNRPTAHGRRVHRGRSCPDSSVWSSTQERKPRRWPIGLPKPVLRSGRRATRAVSTTWPRLAWPPRERNEAAARTRRDGEVDQGRPARPDRRRPGPEGRQPDGTDRPLPAGTSDGASAARQLRRGRTSGSRVRARISNSAERSLTASKRIWPEPGTMCRHSTLVTPATRPDSSRLRLPPPRSSGRSPRLGA